MKKLILSCSILFVFTLFLSANAQAQIPKPDLGGLNKPALTDKNFEPQKFTPVLGVKRSIAYEVWITTDGVLHCKTSSTLKTASIKFTQPTVSSTNANGDTTGSSGSFSRKFELNKPEDSDAYLFDIASDKYKEKHAITLMITSTSGSKAEVTLINKKVPAKIEK